jgi:preprotein translocase SecE subunit
MTNNLNIFFQEVWQEFNKIVWPARKELFVSVLGTLAIILIFSLYLGFLDVLIAFAVNKVIYVLV